MFCLENMTILTETRQTRSRGTDENVVSTRITRAKAAAAGGLHRVADDGKPMVTRNRAALGDLSNVNKENTGLSGKSMVNKEAITLSGRPIVQSRTRPLVKHDSEENAGVRRALRQRVGLQRTAATSATTATTTSSITTTNDNNSKINNNINDNINDIDNSSNSSNNNNNINNNNNTTTTTTTTSTHRVASRNHLVTTQSTKNPASYEGGAKRATLGSRGTIPPGRRQQEGLSKATSATTTIRRALKPVNTTNTQQPARVNVVAKREHEECASTVDDYRAAKRPKTSHQEIVPWDDLDKEDNDDPLMVSEYVVEIFEFLYKLQKTYMPDPNYVDKQTHFNWLMRGVLVDWLVEVHTKFRLLPETLFLAVNIVDRYLSEQNTELDQIQLIGITSLFIAAKYEEVFSPAVANFSYLADGYSMEDILEAERLILQVLDFRNSYPNPMNFLRRISKADDYDIQTRTIGKYLLEISLFEPRLLKYLPSDHAAAAMFLSRRILNRLPWDANLAHYAGDRNEKAIAPIVAVIIDYLVAPVIHEAFFKKYASKRFLKASIIARSWAKENKSKYPIIDNE
jgi:hypothetical protein